MLEYLINLVARLSGSRYVGENKEAVVNVLILWGVTFYPSIKWSEKTLYSLVFHSGCWSTRQQHSSVFGSCLQLSVKHMVPHPLHVIPVDNLPPIHRIIQVQVINPLYCRISYVHLVRSLAIGSLEVLRPPHCISKDAHRVIVASKPSLKIKASIVNNNNRLREVSHIVSLGPTM